MNDDPPVVFASSFEGLRRALGPAFDASFRDEASKRGVSFDKLHAAYPLATWLETLELASNRLAPGVSQEARYLAVGRRFVRGFTESGVGFAAVAVGRALGPKRMLQRMGRNFQAGTNYLETALTEVGPTELRMSTFVNARFIPRMGPGSMAYAHFRQGILEETLAMLKVKGTVELVDFDVEKQNFTYRVKW